MTRTIKFVAHVPVRFVVDDEYLFGERMLHPEVSAALDSDEEFIEAVLRARLRNAVGDGVQGILNGGVNDRGQPLLRVHAPAVNVQRVDRFKARRSGGE
jgi:hypothetical protein